MIYRYMHVLCMFQYVCVTDILACLFVDLVGPVFPLLPPINEQQDDTWLTTVKAIINSSC